MPNYLAPLVMALALSAGPAFAADAFLGPRVSAVPGGVLTFKVTGSPDQAPTARFNGRPVMVVRQNDSWVAILGIGLSIEPGEYHLDVARPGRRAEAAIHGGAQGVRRAATEGAAQPGEPVARGRSAR